MKAFIDTADMRDFVSLFSYKIIDKIFGLSDLEIDLFAFSRQVELEFCAGLVVLEVAGVYFSYTGAGHADKVVSGLFRHRHEYGPCDVDLLFSYDVIDGQCIVFDCILDRYCRQDQQYTSEDY